MKNIFETLLPAKADETILYPATSLWDWFLPVKWSGFSSCKPRLWMCVKPRNYKNASTWSMGRPKVSLLLAVLLECTWYLRGAWRLGQLQPSKTTPQNG